MAANLKVFADGNVLTAADVNDYLMEQAVIRCTSGDRPSSPNEGMTIRETDTDRALTYDGSAWVRTAEWFSSSGRTGVSVRRAANQSIADATTAAITFDTEDVDTDGFIAVSSTTITIPSGLGGLYVLGWHITGESGGSNDIFSGYIRVSNGVHRFRSLYPPQSAIGSGTSGIGSGGLLRLSAADTIILYCAWNDFSTFTSSQNVQAELNLYRIGA